MTTKLSSMPLAVFLLLVACVAVTKSKPTDQDAEPQNDPIHNAMDVIVGSAQKLANDLHEMILTSHKDGMTLDEIKTICESSQEEFQELIKNTEDLVDVANQNGKQLNIQASPEEVLEKLDEATAGVSVSPEDVLGLVLKPGDQLSASNTQLAVSMSMLNQLSVMINNEATVGLHEAPTQEAVERSLDNILVIAGAVVEVTNGMLETIAGIETKVEELAANGELPDQQEVGAGEQSEETEQKRRFLSGPYNPSPYNPSNPGWRRSLKARGLTADENKSEEKRRVSNLSLKRGWSGGANVGWSQGGGLNVGASIGYSWRRKREPQAKRMSDESEQLKLIRTDQAE